MPVQVRQPVTLLSEVFIHGSVCELYQVLMNYASMKALVLPGRSCRLACQYLLNR